MRRMGCSILMRSSWVGVSSIASGKKGCEDIAKLKGFKKSKGEELAFEDFELMANKGVDTNAGSVSLPQNEPPVCG